MAPEFIVVEQSPAASAPCRLELFRSRRSGVALAVPLPIITPPVDEPYNGPFNSVDPPELPSAVPPVPAVPKLDCPVPCADAVKILPLADSTVSVPDDVDQTDAAAPVKVKAPPELRVIAFAPSELILTAAVLADGPVTWMTLEPFAVWTSNMSADGEAKEVCLTISPVMLVVGWKVFVPVQVWLLVNCPKAVELNPFKRPLFSA